MVFNTLSPLSTPDTQDHRNLQQFLQLHLVPDTTLMLPVAQLTEVLSIPLGQIVPIPQMPSWIMGVYNWRGQVLWLVDLGELLGLTPWHQQNLTTPVHRAVVLHSTPKAASGTPSVRYTLGLVVSHIDEMEWCQPSEIQSPPTSAVTPSLAPFLRGYWLNPQGKMLIVLDGEAIIAAMPKS
ncbi:CheW protein [Rippkaea orientalis PCC 8801]|uniref:CheW protein n=1 Tax=Rippkaea orientalis (strain PCC 8801 / RF-1) TaxID=41431 RepID=B7JZ97_RIPO1|nr:CheW domain-containing protein [Rippkaea orientalis]ACK67308.1 CheW protein [Rippkaea orientalis PCC 8801]